MTKPVASSNRIASALPASREAHRYLIQLLVAMNRSSETPEPLRSLIKLTSAAERPGLIASLPRFFERRSRFDVPWVATSITAGMAIFFLLLGVTLCLHIFVQIFCPQPITHFYFVMATFGHDFFASLFLTKNHAKLCFIRPTRAG
mgnify:CR=1 FL=1